MKSPENGTAELKARHPLNCESTEKYELSIAAVACNGLVSDRSVKTSQKTQQKLELDSILSQSKSKSTISLWWIRWKFRIKTLN